MEVEETGDELADLDALERTINGDTQSGAVNASASGAVADTEKSLGAKAAEYSVDGISSLDDLDALEKSITLPLGAEPEPEPESQSAIDLSLKSKTVEADTAAQSAARSSRTGCTKYLPVCCVGEWWTQEVHPAKKEELAHVFAYFDVDGNGSIDKHELRAVIKDLCSAGHSKQPTDELINDMMAAGDKDGDGSIDFPEFVELVMSAEFNLHPGICDRCQNPRRERRCFQG